MTDNWVIELKRCEAGQPDTGLQCGLPAGHTGNHTALIPSDAPWFPGNLPTIGGNDATVKPVEKLTIGEIRTVEDLPLIVTHSDDTVRVTVEVQTCATCMLWIQRYAAMGECMLPWDYDSAVRIDHNGMGDPSFMTPGYHSCAGWQQRGGE